MKIKLKQDALVMLQGPMGSGKTTFCQYHFLPHDVVSTDKIRESLSGDFEDQSVNDPTFEILHAIMEARAKHGLFTVVDSTGSNSVLIYAEKLAKQYDRPLYLLKFSELLPEQITEHRMQHRMKYIDAYYRQCNRIRKFQIPKAYEVIEIPRFFGRGTMDAITRTGEPVQIEYEGPQDTIELDPQFAYMVIGDLHGEYEPLEYAKRQCKDYDNLRIIQLGDIVDRGESSYKTFQLIKELREAGKLFSVTSNHDNKFYRYCTKWLASADDNKYEPFRCGIDITYPNFGMTLNNGLELTVEEMFSLPVHRMEEYAKEFVAYYESLPSMLSLQRGKTRHVFAHASVNRAMAEGRPLRKSDKSAAIYEGVLTPEVTRETFSGLLRDGESVIMHVGHNYGYNNIFNNKPALSMDGEYGLFQHDIGFGKRYVEFMPKFTVI